MKPKPNKKSESALQVECFTWFHNSYPSLRGLLFSIPNGGLRSKREAARLKLEGLTKGVPDMLFLYKNKLHAIELKTIDGHASPEQLSIHSKWAQQGIDVRIVRDVQTFKDTIKRIINEQ